MRAISSDKKLLPEEEVEVRQHEEGLRGSWHAGVVIKAKKLRRFVQYKELLSEDNTSKLIEAIKIRKTVEGWTTKLPIGKNYRGSIRPLPPPVDISSEKWSRGLCVDALYEDAWWEGVVLDGVEESEEKSVFFPDEGDEQKIDVKNLRVTQDWDEVKGGWNVRGHWILAVILEKFEGRGISIKEVWYHIRMKDEFLQKVGEWTVGEKKLWLQFVKEVIAEYAAGPVRQLLAGVSSTAKKSKLALRCWNRTKSKGSSRPQDSSASLDSNLFLESVGAHDSQRNVENVGARRSRRATAACGTGDSKRTLSLYKSRDTIIALASPGADRKVSMGCRRRKKPREVPRSKTHLKDGVDSITREAFVAPSVDPGLKNIVECGNGGEQSLKAAVGRVGMKDQSDSIDTELFEASVRKAGVKAQTGSIGGKIHDTSASGPNSKDQLGCVDTVSSYASASVTVSKVQIKGNGRVARETPNGGADIKDPSECIGGVLSETPACGTLLEDGIVGLPDNELSQAPASESSEECRSLALAIHGKPLQQRTPSQRSVPLWAPPAEGMTINSEYCPPAALTYDLMMKKGAAQQARSKAKMHLLAVGWRVEFKPRKGRLDIRYVSPTGQNYYSLLQACMAWKKEHTVKGLIDGNSNNNEEADHSRKCILGDDREASSESLLSQKNAIKGAGKLSSSSGEYLTRSDRSCSWFNENESAEHPLKNARGLKQLEYRNQKSHERGSKKRNAPCEVFPMSECFDQEIGTRNASTQEPKLENFKRDPLYIPGCGSRKRKSGLEESFENQKRKKGKTCRLFLKRKGKSANGYRMQVLLSTPGKSKDLPSCPGKRTVRSVLSWMIENGVVAQNQRVFYWNRKDNCPQAEGCITCEGILCLCCKKVFSLTNFEVHAGSRLHRPSANLILEDGRSLLQCQMQILDNNNRSRGRRTTSRERRKKKSHLYESDDICSICHVGGTLILCDHCPSSFHLECIDMEVVPEGNWYCPRCRCVLCGRSEFNGDGECFTEMTVLFCDQCECQYHVGCLYERGMARMDSCPEGNWFCSKKCSEIFAQLRSLVGTVNLVGTDGLSWTLLRSREEDNEGYDPSEVEVMAEHHSKLSVALTVMHECFVPIIEPRTKKDLISEVIFNKGSDLNRLNFRGFYTMILERGDELISVATTRIHGGRVAEMPLIGTRVEYRRKGMCRLLVNELEKLLHSLGVEKLILPAVAELKETWKNAFAFQEMTAAERLKLLELNFVGFPDTTVLQKFIAEASSEQERMPGAVTSVNGEDLSHLCLGGRHEGLETQKGRDSENVDIDACKIGSSYSEVVETVTPIRSLPSDICTCPLWHGNAEGEGCFSDNKMEGSLLKRPWHTSLGSAAKEKSKSQENAKVGAKCQTIVTPVKEPDEDSMVVVGTTRSNRLVRQVRWKVAYSCQQKDDKPCPSEEFQSNGKSTRIRRKKGIEGDISRRKRQEETAINNKYPIFHRNDSTGSCQCKDIQSGSSVLKEPVERVPIIGATGSADTLNIGISNLEGSAPVVDRPTLLQSMPEHKTIRKEEYRGNVVGNSDYHNSNEPYKENGYGHLSCLESFKFFYRRRRKQICASNGLPGDVPSNNSLPLRPTILHSHTVC